MLLFMEVIWFWMLVNVDVTVELKLPIWICRLLTVVVKEVISVCNTVNVVNWESK